MSEEPTLANESQGIARLIIEWDSGTGRLNVAQAPDPAWRYVIVSLKDPEPVLRSYRITDGTIREEPVQLDGG